MNKLSCLIFETIDFYYEFRKQIPEKLSKNLAINSSKLRKIATMAPSQLIFDKKQELKNKFFKQIAQDFILVKIKNVFANNKLDIEISLILSNLK